MVASMAGGLRRATPGAAEVSEAVLLCVVLCRGVWVCGCTPPPPKALCAIGPALVHRATHHQCIAVPVVGVWVRPHGMQPCVADVLRCVPPLHRSHCTQSRPRGGPKSFSPRPLWSSPACVLAVLGLQFADSCGTHAVEMMIPVPLHVYTRGGVVWGGAA